MAKLNLYQCLSVARPYYEDIFCLGLHVMSDTGQCVAGSIGHPQPADGAPVIAAVAVETAPSPGSDSPLPVSRKRR